MHTWYYIFIHIFFKQKESIVYYYNFKMLNSIHWSFSAQKIFIGLSGTLKMQ